jgi:hypothetical protein
MQILVSFILALHIQAWREIGNLGLLFRSALLALGLVLLLHVDGDLSLSDKVLDTTAGLSTKPGSAGRGNGWVLPHFLNMKTG